MEEVFICYNSVIGQDRFLSLLADRWTEMTMKQKNTDIL